MGEDQHEVQQHIRMADGKLLEAEFCEKIS